MKKAFLFLILLIFIWNNSLIAQNGDWRPLTKEEGSEHSLLKQDGNIYYLTDDSTFSVAQRENMVAKTKEHIVRDLEVLGEREFSEPVIIFFLQDRNQMYKLFGRTATSEIIKPNNIVCVYDAEHWTLNRELMKLIIEAKWGKQNDSTLQWIEEGLRTYVSPEADDCDGYTIEERYSCFLLNDKLLDINKFPDKRTIPDYKIACNQSAYLVGYLIQHYGTEKLKQLWNEGMVNFEKIYQIELTILTEKMNGELNRKYPNPVAFNWELFTKGCIDSQQDSWFPAYNPSSNEPNSELNKMVTKIDGNLKFTLYSIIPISERNEIIRRAKESITQSIELINESPFNDSIHIILFPTKNDMKNLIGVKDLSGLALPKDGVFMSENTIYAVYGEKYNTLGHEIMHMVIRYKWGRPKGMRFTWFDEGLATLAGPDAENCDGHTFEERYAYFLQNGKLIELDVLTNEFIAENNTIGYKIAYSQSAYIVNYLLENYGLEKFKLLWNNGMDDFKVIYKHDFKYIIANINEKISKKYQKLIYFNSKEFEKDCIE